MARFNKENERASFIVECFEEFYRELLAHKHLVFSKPWTKATDKNESTPNATAEFILTKLQYFLEQQSVKSRYGGNAFSLNYYEEAKFIMVALADEIFLNLDWPGKPYWETSILEERIYSTHSAGQTFFEKLDLLLFNKDPVRVEIGIIFLSALGLGFRGKYRHFDDQGALNSYKVRLFTFINRREPYLFQQKIHLFPDTYAHSLEGAEAKELPNLRNWYLIFAGIGFTYLLFSFIIWYFATADINKIINRIISYNETEESRTNDK